MGNSHRNATIMKIKRLLILFFVGSMLNLHAQETAQQNSLNTEWKDYFQNEKVRIEVADQPCNDIANGIFNNYKIFKVTNKTDVAIKISFQQQMWYDQDKYCTGCEGGSEFAKSVSLAPNETKTGSCTGPNDLKIFRDSPDGFKSALSRFELKNIVVTVQ